MQFDNLRDYVNALGSPDPAVRANLAERVGRAVQEILEAQG